MQRAFSVSRIDVLHMMSACLCNHRVMTMPQLTFVKHRVDGASEGASPDVLRVFCEYVSPEDDSGHQ